MPNFQIPFVVFYSERFWSLIGWAYLILIGIYFNFFEELNIPFCKMICSNLCLSKLAITENWSNFNMQFEPQLEALCTREKNYQNFKAVASWDINMGGKSSKHDSPRCSHNHDNSYGGYVSQSDHGSSSSSYSRNYVDYQRISKLQSKYRRIDDNYHSLEQVLCWCIFRKTIFFF